MVKLSKINSQIIIDNYDGGDSYAIYICCECFTQIVNNNFNIDGFLRWLYSITLMGCQPYPIR